jgi:hypothetical protein
VRLALFGTVAYASAYCTLMLLVFGSLSERTFPWQTTDRTAAAIGSAYAGSLVMCVVATRAREWASVRTIVPSVGIVIVGVLAASILEHRALRLSGGPVVAFVASYLWFLVHAVLVVVLVIAVWRQRRSGGGDRRGTPAMPWPLRLPCWIAGSVLLAAGLALFGFPRDAGWWPWTVSAIDARVLGVWAVALGVGVLAVDREADLWRATPGLCGVVVTAALELVTLARFRTGAEGPGLTACAAVMATLLVVGTFGLACGGPWRARRL